MRKIIHEYHCLIREVIATPPEEAGVFCTLHPVDENEEELCCTFLPDFFSDAHYDAGLVHEGHTFHLQIWVDEDGDDGWHMMFSNGIVEFSEEQQAEIDRRVAELMEAFGDHVPPGEAIL